MPPKPKPESEKAKFDPPISFRWNVVKHTHHAKAMPILVKKRAEGHSDADIFAYAVIHAEGMKIPTGTNRDLVSRLERIEGKIDEQAALNQTIVDALQNMDLSAFVHQGTGRTFREELGDRVPDSAYNQINQSVNSADFDVD